MVRRVDVSVLDMLQSINWIGEDSKGMTFADFCASRLTQQAVERNVEIISEASRRIPEHFKERHSNVPWRSIAGVGNLLRHDYHDIRTEIIWDIVVADLPILKAALQSILAELRGPSSP